MVPSITSSLNFNRLKSSLKIGGGGVGNFRNNFLKGWFYCSLFRFFFFLLFNISSFSYSHFFPFFLFYSNWDSSTLFSFNEEDDNFVLNGEKKKINFFMNDWNFKRKQTPNWSTWKKCCDTKMKNIYFVSLF